MTVGISLSDQELCWKCRANVVYKEQPEMAWREYACTHCGQILRFGFTKEQSQMPCPKCESFVIAPPFIESDRHCHHTPKEKVECGCVPKQKIHSVVVDGIKICQICDPTIDCDYHRYLLMECGKEFK